MTYSKSRPKILSSGIMDTLSSFAYFVLAILFFIFGAVLLNTDVSGGEDNMSGAIQEIGGAFATGILGVLSIVVGIICLIAMLISLVGTVITLRSVNKDFSALKNRLNMLKIAAGFNYAAMGIFFVGAIYDFTQCGNDATLVAGACVLLAVSIFRGVSAVFKTLAIKEISVEQVENSELFDQGANTNDIEE